jgi:hypothetical protein
MFLKLFHTLQLLLTLDKNDWHFTWRSACVCAHDGNPQITLVTIVSVLSGKFRHRDNKKLYFDHLYARMGGTLSPDPTNSHYSIESVRYCCCSVSKNVAGNMFLILFVQFHLPAVRTFLLNSLLHVSSAHLVDESFFFFTCFSWISRQHIFVEIMLISSYNIYCLHCLLLGNHYHCLMLARTLLLRTE